jgi:Bacterial Ig domain/Bacterial Ig-like domain (group 1)
VIEPRRRHAVPIGLLLAVSVAACGDVTLPEEGEPAKLEVISGNQQQGPAGSVLPDPLVVRVTDSRSRPVASQDVAFSVESGGGSVTPATVQTDANGQAAAEWTLGSSTGNQLLRVRTARGGSTTPLEVSFSAMAVSGTASNLAEVSGDEQTGPVNSALADSLVVRVTDALGNPVAGVEVAWTVSGGGSISPAAVVTGADGLAAAERVLGPTAGAQSAQAAVEGFTGSPVSFTHTAVPANPTALVLVSGDDQTGPGGFTLAGDLVVRLEDDNGNGIGARPITWVVPIGSGSVDPVSSTTDANGLATTRWTLPGSVGSFTVNAVFSGLPAVQFTATATADVPTTIELVSGDNQSASVGSTLANPLVVRVTDANDIPVANVGVSWEAQGGGSVSAATSATDASGLAQINRTLGLVPGSYTTTATVEGLEGSPVTFTSTATVGPAAMLAIITQPGTTTATSGQALAPQPEIEVQDAQGNPILQGGRTVSASITSSPEDPSGPGSAVLAGASDVTNSSGRTTYTNLRITGPSGAYVLTFSSGALTPVTSQTITLGAGSANRIVILQQPSSSAINGVVFPQQPIVQVQDAAGNPVPTAGLAIAASIQDGQPALGPSAVVNATTDGTGTATFSGLRITGVVGNRTLSFSRPGLVAVESNQISVTAGSPSSLAIAAGDNQAASVNTAVATDPSVIVTDVSGNPISGVEVEFEVTGGGGSVNPGTVTTGSNGIATVDSWTLGPSAGANTLVASVPSAPGLGTETFDATATAVNQPPTAQADAYLVDEDAPLNVDEGSGVLANDDDPEDDDLTAILDGGPSSAQTFTLNPNGSFTYTPSPDFNGSDSFTYHAFDGQANSSTVTVTITVNPVNDDPGFSAGPDVEVSALGSILGFTDEDWATGISPGPPDESGQTVSFQVSTNDPGAFTAAPAVDPAGTLTFTPAITLTQVTVTGTITAEDNGGGTSESQNFAITINP